MEMTIVGNTMKFDFTKMPTTRIPNDVTMITMSRRINHVFKSYVMPAATFCSIMTATIHPVFAATSTGAGIASSLMPLINMIRDLALPVGIAVSSWGLIEIMIGNVPSGKQKLKFSIIGFIGMYIIPTIFYAIRDGFGTSILPH